MDPRTFPTACFLALFALACSAPPKHSVSPAPPPAASSGTAAPSASPSPSPPPAPAAASKGPSEGEWRVSGGSNALFLNRDVGDVEQTTFGLAATAGKMVTSNLLIEGLFEFDTTDTEVQGGDSSESLFLLGAGARYYFDVEGSTFPYLGAQVGLAFLDFEAGGFADDDSSPFVGLSAGAETFLSETFALDYGLRFRQAFDIFDEELTDIALFLGLSIWW